MSRIHDALRIAEQTGNQTVPVLPDLAGPETVHASATERHSGNGSGMGAAAAVAAAKEPAVDTLLTVRRESWRFSSKLIDFEHEVSIGSEEFRTLRSRMMQIRAHKQLRSVLVCSALPSEGKSFVAVNLARALSCQPNVRVLLVDADLRRPTADQLLGAPASPGLGDFLDGTATEHQIVQQGPTGNLFLLPAGTAKKNAAELLSSPRLEALMRIASASFDWVILDSPPALPVSDSSNLSNFCDGVLLVVSSGQTSIEEAVKGVNEFKPDSVVGVVLNRAAADSTFAAYYGSYRSSGNSHPGKKK